MVTGKGGEKRNEGQKKDVQVMMTASEEAPKETGRRGGGAGQLVRETATAKPNTAPKAVHVKKRTEKEDKERENVGGKKKHCKGSSTELRRDKGKS